MAQAYVDHLAGADDDDEDKRPSRRLREGRRTGRGPDCAQQGRPRRPRTLSTNGSTTRESRCWVCRTSGATRTTKSVLSRSARNALSCADLASDSRTSRTRTETGFALAELVGKHLMSDVDGLFPLTSLNEWEKTVVRKETARLNCVAWYRNPSVSAADSLGITYRDLVGNWRAVHPDFIFFNLANGLGSPVHRGPTRAPPR